MKKFKVTMMIPQERTVDAVSAQDAHNIVSAMMGAASQSHDDVRPVLISIEPVKEGVVVDFGPSPAA